ncbi:PAS domain-containing protein [Aromatoleum sp.]|uniref:PAS domain-containing protein n=1 Tax=Aromatoleum sp. TaxID=2307007 RepID=UPI002FC958C8
MRCRLFQALPAHILAPLLLATFALTTAALNYFLQQSDLRNEVAAEQRARITEILSTEESRLEVQFGLGNALEISRLVASLGLRAGITHALLVNSEGMVVAAMSRTQIGWPLTEAIASEPPAIRTGILEIATYDPKGIRTVLSEGDEDGLLAQVAVYPDHKLIVRVDLGPSLTARAAGNRYEVVRETLMIIFGAALLGTLLHFLWFRRTAQLTAAVTAIGEGHLDVRAGLSGRDELARIGLAVDRMAADVQARQAKLQRLSALIDRSPVVAIEWRNTPGWPVSFVSESISQWGYTVEELLADDVLYTELIHPDDLPQVEASVAARLAGGGDEYRHEYRLRTADGNWTWVEARTWLSSDPYGVVTACRGVLVDITKRKRAEDVLREQADLLSLFYDLPFIGMAITSPMTKRWLKTNARLCEILGYPREELFEKSWVEITHPDDVEGSLANYERAMRGEIDGYRIEKRFLRKDGSVVFTTLDARAVRRDNGEVEYFISTVQDISEFKRIELDLQQQKERLERAEAHAKLGSWEFELDTQRVWWSPQLYVLLGADSTRERATFDTFLEHVHPDDRSCVVAAFHELLHGRIVDVAPFRSSPEHTALSWWFSTVAVETDSDGAPRKVSGTLLDVTALKHGEEALRRLNADLETRVAERTQQLEDANRELASFSYAVSHDLKGPLRGIDGYSQILLEDHRERLDDEGRRLLANVRRGVAQMHELIEDLLAYSRIERRPLDSSVVAVPELVHEVLDGLAHEIAANGSDVKVEIPPLELSLDRNGLALVLRNLIGNALKFSGNAAPPRIEIGADLDDRRARLWVRDNGIGFDMKYHDRIFDIFQRLHRAEDYPGTGVGLALVRKAMQRMGGTVWAESEPGRGSTFFLEFPR